MLVEVSSIYGWIEKDLPDAIAIPMLNGGTARPLGGEVREIRIVTVKHNAARVTGNPRYEEVAKAKARLKKLQEADRKGSRPTPDAAASPWAGFVNSLKAAIKSI